VIIFIRQQKTEKKIMNDELFCCNVIWNGCNFGIPRRETSGWVPESLYLGGEAENISGLRHSGVIMHDSTPTFHIGLPRGHPFRI
jgi:hypothetical protein